MRDYPFFQDKTLEKCLINNIDYISLFHYFENSFGVQYIITVNRFINRRSGWLNVTEAIQHLRSPLSLYIPPTENLHICVQFEILTSVKLTVTENL